MDSLNTLRSGGGQASTSSTDGLTRAVDDGPQRIGRSGLSGTRRKLFGYDRVQGMVKVGGKLTIEIDTSDRMSARQAVAKLQEIHAAHGLTNSMESILYQHDQALFICYSFNAASQIGPYARAGYRILGDDGSVSDFEYLTVHTLLGIDLRRFFRAYANEVVDACRDLYYKIDPDDQGMLELREMMISLADKKGISRYPWLIADCAEAATNLSAGERAAVVESKRTVIGGTVNAVDSRNISARPIRSLDNYDSSNGKAVSGNNDIHASAQYYD